MQFNWNFTNLRRYITYLETKTRTTTRSSERAWTRVILAGKRDNRHHSTTGFSENVEVTETSYKMLESFISLRSEEGLASFNKNNWPCSHFW